VIVVRPFGAIVERLTGGVMFRGAPGEELPASHYDIDISGVELETVAISDRCRR
jgi:hypothetical protein